MPLLYHTLFQMSNIFYRKVEIECMYSGIYRLKFKKMSYLKMSELLQKQADIFHLQDFVEMI